jgi:hypothetical protein
MEDNTWNENGRYQLFENGELHGTCDNLEEIYQCILDEMSDGITSCWDAKTGLVWNSCDKSWQNDLDDFDDKLVCVPNWNIFELFIQENGKSLFVPFDEQENQTNLQMRPIQDGQNSWLIIDTKYQHT